MTVAREYLTQHGIDLKVAADAGVRADGDFLCFPYTAPDGSTFERRKPLTGGHILQPKGQPLVPWWPLGRSTGLWCLIAEGESDALAAATVLINTQHEMLGGVCPVGIPGASTPARVVAADLIEAQAPGAYLVMDPDEAGRKASNRLTAELLSKGIKVVAVELPDGRDLSDCIAAASDPEAWLANALMDAEACADEQSDALIADLVRGKLS